ncbi:hypothetical protein CALVIDRAFT_597724 [Calocera viscosa TUFC12733]|uniref:Uncharacterized protein n=1 Tax=Calocera viscosa (strain TUFC12733) TaxID=1330018 RepID=A0A167N7Y9_CALVF|nr:hypothetical protein CALVIDRAFT_597724 [Calocera viscosa TUFC12733]
MSIFDYDLYEAYTRERKPLPKRTRPGVPLPVNRSEIQERAQNREVDPVDSLVLSALEEPLDALARPADEVTKNRSRPKKELRQRNNGPIFGTPAPSFQFGHQAASPFNFKALSAALDDVEQEKNPAASDVNSQTPLEDEADDIYIPPEITGPLTQAEQDAIDALNFLLSSATLSTPPQEVPSQPIQTIPFSLPASLEPFERRLTTVHSAVSLPDDPEFKEVKLAAQSWKPGTISPLFKRASTVPPPEGKSFESTARVKHDLLAPSEDEELLWTDEDSDDEDVQSGSQSRPSEKSFEKLLEEVGRTGPVAHQKSHVRSTGEVVDDDIWNRSVMAEAEQSS